MSERHNGRDLKSSIRELATALESGLDDHLTPAKLQDFLAGDLPEPERERVEEHLALCRECARAALDLAESERRGDLLTEGELEAQWDRFRSKIEPASWWQWQRSGAIAAILLMAVLGVWGLREFQKPPSHLYALDLDPVEQRRGGLEEPVRIPAWADPISLNLYLDASGRSSGYRVEILAEDNRPVWSQSGIPSQDDRVVVEVPARFLPDGTYLIRLSGSQGKPLEYEIRIKHLSPS